jgi:hypothetical protein
LTAAISSVDAANCYDSIAHAIASLIFQACGVPVEGVEAMLLAIQDMKYFLRTASRNFRGSKIEIKYQGLCPGNGAAPAGWAAISITILNAHKKKGHSATFMCPITNKVVKLVDHCDLIHIDMTDDDDVYTTFQKMQEALLNWGSFELLPAAPTNLLSASTTLSPSPGHKTASGNTRKTTSSLSLRWWCRCRMDRRLLLIISRSRRPRRRWVFTPA